MISQEIKNSLKNYFKKYIKQILLSFTLFTLLLISWYMFYSFQREKQNILIDAYNFEQLEKVKLLAETTTIFDKKFANTNILKFNKMFKQNIQPKKNCYYIWWANWPEKYILLTQNMLSLLTRSV